MYKKLLYSILVAVISFNLSAQQLPSALTDEDLSNISEVDIKKVLDKKIFFAHRSVGYNVLQGLDMISRQDRRFSFNISHQLNSNNSENGIFYHAKCGQNGVPSSKIQDFFNQVDSQLKGNIDIAFLKFCYVDFSWHMDVEALFREYQTTVDKIRKKYPAVRIIHVTVPLKSAEERNNYKRHQYNELVRKTFKGKEPVFDLAGVESRTPDGENVFFVRQNTTIPKLYKGYTNDGGHLNKLGQWVAAKELILTLVETVNSFK